MTRFSADWHARRELEVIESERKLVDKACGVEITGVIGPGAGDYPTQADCDAHFDFGNVEFVNITGMGVSRVPAPPRAAASSPLAPVSSLSSARSGPTYPLAQLCRAHGLPVPQPEFRFHPERKWRFDYAWPQQKVFVEIEGGLFIQGRHNRGAGMRADFEKYNAASSLGWRGYHYLPEQINSRAIADLRIEFAR